MAFANGFWHGGSKRALARGRELPQRYPSRFEEVLAWAAGQDRVLLTHDVTTITHYASQRLMRGERLPGVFEVVRGTGMGVLIEDILLIDQCSAEGEWDGRICYLPLARD